VLLQNFGLDYVAFSKMVDGCPLNYLTLAFNCCQVGHLITARLLTSCLKG